MKTFLEKIKELWNKHKDKIAILTIAYLIHLTIEGFLANVIYYKIAKPIIAAI